MTILCLVFNLSHIGLQDRHIMLNNIKSIGTDYRQFGNITETTANYRSTQKI